jgi:hypothetical protein
MPVEIHGTCLGNLLRRRIQEGEKLTFLKKNVEEEPTEEGISIMMRNVLVKPEKEVKELVERNSLLKTSCNTKDRVCKVIIESESTDNLVSTRMVEKLNLETNAHMNGCKHMLLLIEDKGVKEEASLRGFS